MKLKDWRRYQQIVREGYFENCSYLPTRLTEFPTRHIYEHWRNAEYRKANPDDQKWLTLRCDEVVVYNWEECECTGSEVFPCYAGGCDFWHCHPVAIPKVEAKQRALYARKYGKMAYMRKYLFKPHNRLQFAKYQKPAKYWGWDK